MEAEDEEAVTLIFPPAFAVKGVPIHVGQDLKIVSVHLCVPGAFGFLTYHCRFLLNELRMMVWVAWVQESGHLLVSHRFTLLTFRNTCLSLGDDWSPCT